MPFLPNKVELNTDGIRALAYACECALQAAAYLSKEVIALGGGEIHGNQLLRDDATKFLDAQERLCADVDAALMAFYVGQTALNEKRRKWLDTQIKP